MLLTPTYINILNVYAFCNTHDITWGTKGDDKAEKLPSANVKPDGKVDVRFLKTTATSMLSTRPSSTIRDKSRERGSEASAADKQEDYYKSFRSNVVTVWMVTNFILVAAVLNISGFQKINVNDTKKQNSMIYLMIVLWSVAGLSLFRFIGACCSRLCDW